MRPAVSTDRAAYPDVSHELIDLVSQQPAPAQAPGVKVKRLGTDEYRALDAAGLTPLDRLIRRDLAPFTPFGFVPRPREWRRDSSPFHEQGSRQELQSASLALRLNIKLEEMFSRVTGQISDIQNASQNPRSFLPHNFNGLVFSADASQEDPERFIQERSLGVVDQLREELNSAAVQKGFVVQDSLQRANALLQLRMKLQQLNRLGNFLDLCFNEVDAVDHGRLKNATLC